ncbi:DUF1574 domain-containing protein [Clostridium sp. BJN0001]|uniref:DUF1574 domain-containing protein n=1 Tax=Clostridium sp. BJN0001 TaxID=2930219 RepID=UPI001FD1B81C|nr:DUF1574 domain-containing protein [Clostridium sp. BJN0001]
MFNVIIFGTGKSRKIVESGFNDDVNVIAYLDNNTDKWNQKINGKYILNPENIKNMEYDYVIIASQYNDIIYNQLINLGVDIKKIFQHNIFFMSIWNDICYRMKTIENMNKDELNLIITGISYAQKGIKTDKLRKKSFSLACFSQDLFYDYTQVKWIINNLSDNIQNLKYVIIGLSYYSFEYDMSLSSQKYRTLLYYDAIKESHHLKNTDYLLEGMNITKKIAKNIFSYDKDGRLDKIDFMFTKKRIYLLSDEKGKEQAERDCNKNYPETVKENTKIFKDYLTLLKDNNIKPIVVVFPVSKYYSKYFSRRVKNEFENILNEVRKDYDFQLIDYFDSDEFTDDDFYDVSHLNNDGALKFTEILNNIIKW